MNTKFNRERIRFDVKQPDTLVIQGWFEDDTEGAEQFEASETAHPQPSTYRCSAAWR